MTFSFVDIALCITAYLGILFAIAFTAERGWISPKLIYHPITYILSLGIFASAWAFYGVIDLAQQFGYGALAYYLGTGVLFLFASMALRPLMELARRFQVNSMADLLVFRYHSHSVGGMVTLLILLAMAPLICLQVQAMADTIHLLTQNNLENIQTDKSEFGLRQTFALIYCVAIALFGTIFGSNRSHHRGLVAVMAFESLIKVCGLVAIGLFVVYQIFGGFQPMNEWLYANPQQLKNLSELMKSSSTHALLVIFLATALSMPHIFHMTVVENPVEKSSQKLTWAFPLFLLIMALPVFPILWGGVALELDVPTQYFPLSIPMAAGSGTFALVAFVGGLSAATGALIGIALALSTMILNHWLLPIIHLRTKKDVYAQIVWMRRALIIGIMLSGFLFYAMLNNRFNLTQLALVSFIGTLQLLPGIVAVVHWPKGNRRGFIAGLMLGSNIWFFCLLLPMIKGWSSVTLPFSDQLLPIGPDYWDKIALWSLGLNTLTFLLVSYLSRQSDEERYSAELCSEDELSHPVRLALDIRSPTEIIERLSSRLGRSTAELEVKRALEALNLPPTESRPYSLRRLRDEIEANLSSLLGISMASEIMDRLVPFKVPDSPAATDINLIEDRLSQVRQQFTGLTAELNKLRLYHRRTLQELPIAICSIGADMEVIMWNNAMVKLTGIQNKLVIGAHLADVIEPWGKLLTKFAYSSEPRFYNRQILLNNRPHWITLHKASIPSSIANQEDGQVLLLEDITEVKLLEQELVHSERLASIGRLAAGVAHEIGNPITGIACLAQNLKYDTDNPEILETGDQILSLTQRVTSIVQSLVSFSHAGKRIDQNFQRVRPRECVQEAINLLSLQKERNHVVFENQVPAHLELNGDGQRLIQVFVNLLSNAQDASPEAGHVIVKGHEESYAVTLSVTDEGNGIPADQQRQIFEPFYTTKDPGKGTGLGLAMVYSIVEDHAGLIEIESPANPESKNGTRFIIRLPTNLASEVSNSNTNQLSHKK